MQDLPTLPDDRDSSDEHTNSCDIRIGIQVPQKHPATRDMGEMAKRIALEERLQEEELEKADIQQELSDSQDAFHGSQSALREAELHLQQVLQMVSINLQVRTNTPDCTAHDSLQRQPIHCPKNKLHSSVIDP